MRMRLFLAHVVCMMLISFVASSSAHAQIQSVAVTVNGMSCPFCAFGVEKKLKKVGGTESVMIDMKSGTATLSAKKGKSIDVEQVSRAVKKAGFTAGPIRIEAVGTLKMNEQQRMLLQLDGHDQPFLLVKIKAGIEEQLSALAASGARVRIDGIFHPHVEEMPALSPETCKEISE